VIAFAVFGLVGWQGVTTIGSEGPIDSGEHLLYAQFLDAHGELPGRVRNYEYATPPLFHVAAIGAEHAGTWVPSRSLETSSNLLTRALWLLLAVAAVASMTSARPGVRIAGLAGMVLAAVLGIDEALSLAKTEPWSAGRLITFSMCAGLVLVTALIAREIWPDHPGRALAAGAFLVAYPVVLRMGVLFHPEMPLAFLCSLAILLFLRAARLGWPGRLGWALGATCGAAALTRQTAIVTIVSIAIVAALAGGRRAAGFLARAIVVVALVAGPWWVYAYRTWHNPLQSNLEPRASLMMPQQPLSFYVSFPLRTLVLHPYRPDFDNQLLPKLHAEVWSDWFGAFHHGWVAPTRLDRVTASTQSVLGFVGDALGIVGLAGIAAPAAVRVFRRRSRSRSDVGLGVLALLTVVALAAFVLMLIRFPQQYGDPIKSSYLLFTAPAWAIFSVAAWVELRRRKAKAHTALAGVAALYAISYVTHLGTVFAHPSGTGRTPGGLAGAVDLRTSIQGSSSAAVPGIYVMFAVFVDNTGNQTANHVRLRIDLPAGMNLIGLPYHERGSGCTGTGTLSCDLDFLPAGTGTLVRFELQASQIGDQTLMASVLSDELDLNPSDDDASFTVHVAPPGPQATTSASP
jgi:4-amino-4-deoxy-L-arabinose transferase-like glycosyltransferase